MESAVNSEHVDVLIIGSGPVGSAYARELTEAVPWLSVLMVERGPFLTSDIGRNVRSLPEAERRAAQLRASRSTAGVASDSAAASGGDGRIIAARRGLTLLADEWSSRDDQTGMPAAAVCSNVGGMAAHWTCACPKPGESETIAFLGDAFDSAFDRAERLLGVTAAALPASATSRRLLEELTRLFGDGRADSRRPQPMPLASVLRDGEMRCAGVDAILGPVLSRPGFELRAGTVCRRIRHRNGTATGAELVSVADGRESYVSARAVIVAADSLRSPQLLWASGIRPPALGRYLNDHMQLLAEVILDERFGSGEVALSASNWDGEENLMSVLWVPFTDALPYHTQIMQSARPLGEPVDDANGQRLVVGRFLLKDIRSEDRVEFGEDVDEFGLPAIRIKYELTAKDKKTVAVGLERLHADAGLMGTFADGGQPRLLPAGSSLHYQGTMRMGERDDGTSVCGKDSRVWGMSNLYVGGNGVIPTATTCNPTATAVALAVLASRALAARLAAHDTRSEED